MAKDISIQIGDAAAQKFVLAQTPGVVQSFPVSGMGKEVHIAVHSIYTPLKPGKNKIVYGTIDNVKVMVQENLSERFAIPKNYIANQQQYIMQTDNLNPQKVSSIIGAPYKVSGHPNTIWSQKDIDGFKQAIKTQKLAQEAFAGICSSGDKMIEKAIVVPDEPDLGTNPKVEAVHTAVAQGIANLGIAYVLSGEEKYAQECKRLLLGMAEKYESYPIHSHPKFTHDKSKWSWQRLGDAIWLIPAAWGYDLIKSSDVLTDAG